MILRNIILSFLLSFTTFLLTAQDAILTQYHRAPLHLSPTSAGLGDAPEATINYRYQWNTDVSAGRFHTARAGFNLPVILKSGHRIGLGGDIKTDRSTGSSFRDQGIAINGNYQHQIAEEAGISHWLTGGIRIGFFQQKIDSENFRWGNQNQNGTFNPNLPGESSIPDQKNYLDLGMGVAYRLSLDEGRFLQVGLSAFHLNQPSISFTDNSPGKLTLPIRQHLFLTGRFGFGEKLFWLPRALAMIQENRSFMDFGSELEVPLGRGGIIGGVGFRMAENFDTSFNLSDLIFSLGFNAQRFTFAASYEMNASPEFVPRLNTRALEVAVVYRWAGKI